MSGWRRRLRRSEVCRIEKVDDGAVPGGWTGAVGGQSDGVIDEPEEPLVVRRVAEAYAHDGGPGGAPALEQKLDPGMFSFVREGVMKAAPSGETETTGGHSVAKSIFQVGRFEHERFAVLAGSGHACALRTHGAALSKLLDWHLMEAPNSGAGFSGRAGEGRKNLFASSAQHNRVADFRDNSTAVFDDTGVSQFHQTVPMFDFCASLAGGKDHGGAGGAKALERREGGSEAVIVVIEEAVVEVGKYDQHASMFAGHGGRAGGNR